MSAGEIVGAVLVSALTWLIGFLQGGEAARGNMKARLYKLMEREDARTSDREMPRDRW